MKPIKVVSEIPVTDDLRAEIYNLMRIFPKTGNRYNYYTTVFVEEYDVKICLYYGFSKFYKVVITKSDSNGNLNNICYLSGDDE